MNELYNYRTQRKSVLMRDATGKLVTDARNNEYMTTKRIVVGEKQNEENN